MTTAPAKPRDKMRISTDPHDAGYRVDWFRFAVFLDGVYQPRCVTADEERGLITIAAEGTIGQRPMLFDLTGTVEIRKREP